MRFRNTYIFVAVFSVLTLGLQAGCPRRAETIPDIKDEPIDLAAFAAKIDPGRTKPLLADAPVWVSVFLRASGGESLDEVLARLRETWTENSVNFKFDDLNQFIAILRDVVALEGALTDESDCDLACLEVFATIYGVLDLREWIDSDSFFGQLLDFGAGAAAAAGVSENQAEELVRFIRGVINRAPVRHRRMAAEILKRAPQSEEATAVLVRLAHDADQDQDFTLSRRLFKTVLARSKQPTGDQWLDLASACSLSYRFTCARRAIAAARRAFASAPRPAAGEDKGKDKDKDADPKEKLDNANEQLGHARRAKKLENAKSLGDRMARAEALMLLGRTNQARALYQLIRNDHPRDARPLVGLARLEMSGGLKMKKARRLITEAAGLDHKDHHYYQVAVGTWFQVFMDEILPAAMQDKDHIPELIAAQLPPLRRDLEGLMKYDPVNGAVLDVVVDAFFELLDMTGASKEKQRSIYRASLGKAHQRTAKLRRAHGKNPNVHKLGLFVARLLRERKPAMAAILTKVPKKVEDRESVVTLRRTVLYSMAEIWGDPRALGELRSWAKRAARGKDWSSRAEAGDVYALIARLSGKRAVWAAAERAYRRAMESAPDEEQARLLNNLAVTLYEQGDADSARREWISSRDMNPERRVATLNLLVVEPRDPRIADKLEAEVGQLGSSILSFQARAWALHHRGLTGGALRKKLAELHAEESDDQTMGPAMTASRGVYEDGQFQFSFGYSTREGLVIQFTLESKRWLVVPAPEG